MTKITTRGVMPLLALSLLVLPACDWFGKKNAGSEQVAGGSDVLYAIDGKPVITVAQFEDYYQQVLASDPRLQSMAGFLPNLKREIFDALANQELIVVWADKQKMFDQEEYTKTEKQGLEQIRRMYAAKKFGDDKVGRIVVTESEIMDYYNQHKDPELVATPGGIKASGVEFDSKDKATAFFNKVKANPAMFNQAARTDGCKAKEFASVNKFSFDVDKAITGALEAKTSFPAVVLVQSADKKWWVVLGSSKQETKYRSLDEVRDAIRGAVEREKGMKIFGDEIGKLKETITITENCQYFDQQQADQSPDLQAMLQQVSAQQAQTQEAAKPAVQAV